MHVFHQNPRLIHGAIFFPSGRPLAPSAVGRDDAIRCAVAGGEGEMIGDTIDDPTPPFPYLMSLCRRLQILRDRCCSLCLGPGRCHRW